MSRINHQPAFLLASTPWRENSLRIEVYSRDYGRLSLLARSARARGSELRGVLVPFVPISLSWFGKDELKTLHRAEWIGGWPQPTQRQLLSAHYLNELLLKLSVAEDPNPRLYHDFSQAQQALATQQQPSIALRHFEWQLLNHLGLAPSIQTDNTGNAITAEQFYFIEPEHAAQKVAPTHSSPRGITISGSLLQQLDKQQLTAQSNLSQVLALTRILLDYHIPDHITSRRILQQLSEMKQAIAPR